MITDLERARLEREIADHLDRTTAAEQAAAQQYEIATERADDEPSAENRATQEFTRAALADAQLRSTTARDFVRAARTYLREPNNPAAETALDAARAALLPPTQD